MQKLSKTAKIISILLNILCWGILLGTVYHCFITAWGSINLLRNPGSGVSTTINGITLDYLQFYSEAGIPIDASALLTVNLLELAIYLILVPLLCWEIQLLRKVLRPMIEQRPFSGTSRILKKMGWISTVLAVVSNATDWGLIYHIEHTYQLSNLFLGGTIDRVTFQYEPDITYLTIALVLFILSGVFRYGEELQQLSDETL